MVGEEHTIHVPHLQDKGRVSVGGVSVGGVSVGGISVGRMRCVNDS